MQYLYMKFMGSWINYLANSGFLVLPVYLKQTESKSKIESFNTFFQIRIRFVKVMFWRSETFMFLWKIGLLE